MTTLEDARHVIREHFDELRKLHGVKDIEIFGSYARNERRTDSDLDLLVDFERPVGLLTISMLQVHLPGLLGVEVDVVPKNSLREELWDEVSREAVKV